MRLPAGTTIAGASWEQLTQAVGLATTAHRDDAAGILAAALARVSRHDARPPDAQLTCTWVARVLHAAVAGAPEKGAVLLELASSLCPECADSLQATVELFNDKNVVDDKNGPSAAPAASSGDPAVASNKTPDPNDLNLDDPEVRGLGTAEGFGPGFPGTPGFVGSTPGGGIALPPPAAPPVTAVMNS